MNDRIIPLELRLAARRAFVRTTAQGYAASLTVGLLTSVMSLVTNPADWLLVVVAVALALASPPLAGLVAYLEWLGRGIPAEYEPVALTRRRREARNRAYATVDDSAVRNYRPPTAGPTGGAGNSGAS